MPISTDVTPKELWGEVGEIVIKRIAEYTGQAVSPEAAKMIEVAWKLGFAAQGNYGALKNILDGHDEEPAGARDRLVLAALPPKLAPKVSS